MGSSASHGVLKVLQVDARLTKDLLQGANSQIAMHRYRNAPTSRLNQDWVADEVDADSTRSSAVVKVNRNRLRDLLLQIAEVLALSSDPARSVRIVPPCHQPARLLVTLDLECYFFH